MKYKVGDNVVYIRRQLNNAPYAFYGLRGTITRIVKDRYVVEYPKQILNGKQIGGFFDYEKDTTIKRLTKLEKVLK